MSNFVVAWDESGNIARTFNYTSSSPIWEDIKGDMLGAVNDADYDWQSAYITSEYVSGALGMYVVTTHDTDLKVYYSSDVRALTVIWAEQECFDMNDESVTSEARIASSKTETGLVVVAWKDRTGTLLAQTTDGENWESAINIGSLITDVAGNDNKPIGLAVDGVRRLVTAPDEHGHYFLYLSAAPVNAFDIVAGAGPSNEPFPVVTVDSQNRAYVGMVDELYCVEYPFTSNSYDEDWAIDGGIFQGRYVEDMGWAQGCVEYSPGSGIVCILRLDCIGGPFSPNISHWEVRVNVELVVPNDLAINIKKGAVTIASLLPSTPDIYTLQGDNPPLSGRFKIEMFSSGDSGAIVEHVKFEGMGRHPSHGENCLE